MKYILPGLLIIVLAACSPSGIDSIQREDLFSLDIGPMEDQIALYGLEGSGGMRHIELAMRDGFFYIADNNGEKIVQYNSYGDILFMIYNNETNPEPISLKPRVDNGAQVTRWAYSYPLRSSGKIAVDSRKHIYVEEQLPYERHDFDNEYKALLDSVILHFDSDGRFIEYLGQGGQGGSPFPRIIGLYGSVSDEIAVVCRLPSGWNIYWYSNEGEQLFLIQVRDNAIPAPTDWQNYSSSVDAIMPAPDIRKLYIKVDYYRDVFDESTNTRISAEPISSLIWILNVEKGVYERSLEVPFYEHSLSEMDKTDYARLLYSMLGIVREGGILLYFPIETGYTVLRMDSEGHGQRRGLINIDSSELRYNNFHLSPDGILSALLVDDWKINVVWWRMDKFSRDMQ
ncbi:MAG: hypothetical protein FWC24_06885 [Treponema sp.]|nr:hypothetical protein [Treponema sp.]